MKVTMTCANKYAQDPGNKDAPTMVVFNGARGATCHIACDNEDEANQFKLHGKYQVEVTAVIE